MPTWPGPGTQMTYGHAAPAPLAGLRDIEEREDAALTPAAQDYLVRTRLILSIAGPSRRGSRARARCPERARPGRPGADAPRRGRWHGRDPGTSRGGSEREAPGRSTG